MKSARINFGIGAESEYVLEVDDTGVATKCFNPVTGQELGIGGSDLPEVTAADEGKVLAVNDSGEWVAENKLLFISSTIENDTETLTMTWNDINNALRSKTLVFLTFADETAASINPILFASYEDGSYIVGVNRGTADGAAIYTANSVNDYPAHLWD